MEVDLIKVKLVDGCLGMSHSSNSKTVLELTPGEEKEISQSLYDSLNDKTMLEVVPTKPSKTKTTNDLGGQA
jgi:hypothetical protein